MYDFDLRVLAARGVPISHAEYMADEIFRLQARLNGLTSNCEPAEHRALTRAFAALEEARIALLNVQARHV